MERSGLCVSSTIFSWTMTFRQFPSERPCGYAWRISAQSIRKATQSFNAIYCRPLLEFVIMFHEFSLRSYEAEQKNVQLFRRKLLKNNLAAFVYHDNPIHGTSLSVFILILNFHHKLNLASNKNAPNNCVHNILREWRDLDVYTTLAGFVAVGLYMI